jgi:hypothetical protein
MRQAVRENLEIGPIENQIEIVTTGDNVEFEEISNNNSVSSEV